MLNDLTDLRKLNPKLTLRKARTYPNLLCKWSLSKAQKMVEVENKDDGRDEKSTVMHPFP
jgi:hypothetical protein